MFEFQSVRRSFPRNLTENSEAASFLGQTTSYETEVLERGGFPTEVSDMARNMKMELHTFSLILYQSKNCGHRIHVLFMMHDVY
jgi:hypothetical protein